MLVGVGASDEIAGVYLGVDGTCIGVPRNTLQLRGWTEVDLTTVIKDNSLVEKVADALSRLIEAGESCLTENVHDPRRPQVKLSHDWTRARVAMVVASPVDAFSGDTNGLETKELSVCSGWLRYPRAS